MGYRFTTGKQGAVDYQKKDTSYVGDSQKEDTKDDKLTTTKIK